MQTTYVECVFSVKLALPIRDVAYAALPSHSALETGADALILAFDTAKVGFSVAEFLLITACSLGLNY